MPSAWRQLLLGCGALIAVGFAIGYYFGFPMVGALIVMAGILIAHFRQLVALDKTLQLRKPVQVPDGDGIWARVLASVRYQQQRVRRMKRRYRRLMKEIRQSTNALPDGVIALTDTNVIQRFNAAAQDLVGLQRRRDRGQRIDNLLRHPDFLEYLGETDYENPVVIPSPKLEDRWLSIRIVPYNNNSRLLVIRDITERTRLSRMRRDFVANASHELRTPLTVISGYLEAMEEDGSLDDEWEKPLSEMTQQTNRMRDILDQLLALSRLEVSAPASTSTTVDMAAVIGECVSLLTAGQQRIVVAIESDALVLGEYNELVSIVSNLIGNALRYSWPDTPIGVTWQDHEGGAMLTVSDQGDGIADDDIPRLTERFFRVNRGRARDSGGIGLGLAIVKHSLARHDAQLQITSELRVGSVFGCVFPAERIVGQSADRAAAG
ncbi:MAG: phosphate regulon sensor histidine kinase PhoR [Pseudomonadota bacterium]